MLPGGTKGMLERTPKRPSSTRNSSGSSLVDAPDELGHPDAGRHQGDALVVLAVEPGAGLLPVAGHLGDRARGRHPALDGRAARHPTTAMTASSREADERSGRRCTATGRGAQYSRARAARRAAGRCPSTSGSRTIGSNLCTLRAAASGPSSAVVQRLGANQPWSAPSVAHADQEQPEQQADGAGTARCGLRRCIRPSRPSMSTTPLLRTRSARVIRSRAGPPPGVDVGHPVRDVPRSESNSVVGVVVSVADSMKSRKGGL